MHVGESLCKVGDRVRREGRMKQRKKSAQSKELIIKHMEFQ